MVLLDLTGYNLGAFAKLIMLVYDLSWISLLAFFA
jgi:hypothetical protein